MAHKEILNKIACALLIAQTSQWQQVIDRTDRSGETSAGVPSYTSGGGAWKSNIDQIPAVLQVAIVSAGLNKDGALLLEVGITNDSKAFARIPVSLDQKTVFKNGCAERREIVFSLKSSVVQTSQMSSIVDILQGSNCDPGSFVQLAPARSLLVRMKAPPSLILARVGERIVVTAQILQISDLSYAISGKSDQFTSASTILSALSPLAQ